MGTQGEAEALDDETTALRAARLAGVAERTARAEGGLMPLYVIGTEVPPPGGADHALEAITPRRLFAFSTRAEQRYDQVAYADGDAFLFGPESRGLPAAVFERIADEHRLRLPMCPGNRSLNLSNAVAVTVFEAWRQHGFAGGQ